MGWLIWCWDLLSLCLLMRAATRQIARPTTTYRAGTIGKVLAVTIMTMSTTVIAGCILPFGAWWVLTRPAPLGQVSVPLADSWPGMADGVIRLLRVQTAMSHSPTGVGRPE